MQEDTLLDFSMKGLHIIIIFILIVILVDLKQVYFFVSLKRVRIWLESKTPNELSANLRKFYIQIAVFLAFILIASLIVLVTLLINE